MDGEFAYAVNIGAPFDDVWTVNGVDFTGDEDTDGFVLFSTHTIRDNSWAQPIYGASDSDLALEEVMGTIVWSEQPAGVEIDLDVEAGASYKLQMMFTESCCERGFDIFLEDDLLVEDFAIHENHDEWDGAGNWNIASRDNGVLITYQFVAGDDNLSLVLGGDATAPDFADNNGHLSALTLEVGGGTALQAGDSNMDLEFNQLDLVQVQIAATYLSGQPATWGEGDWDGAPGGTPGSPPSGDGLFNQIDIIAALGAGKYLTGPYAAVSKSGSSGDAQTSIIYNVGTGEVAVDAPAGTELTSINIESAAAIFTGDSAGNLGGSFDNDADNNIFKATFGSSFGSLSFGNVAQAGLSEDFVANDLTVVGSLAGGGDLGNVDLIYIPEPSTLLLLGLGLAGLTGMLRRRC